MDDINKRSLNSKESAIPPKDEECRDKRRRTANSKRERLMHQNVAFVWSSAVANEHVPRWSKVSRVVAN
jgi:hypothetical protein